VVTVVDDGGRPLRVLLLEDNPHDAELVVHELRRAGFAPTWARAENEAQYVEHLDPVLDVILADYSLPGFDALDALRETRARGVDVPVIVVTGSIGEEAAVASLRAGAADYLLKDRLARLGQAVERVIGDRRVQQEKRQAEAARRASEERFRRLAENAQDVIYRYELAPPRLGYVSPAVGRVLGYAPEELYAGIGVAAGIVHPDDRPLIEEAMAALLDGGDATRPLTVRCQHRNGRDVWLEQRVGVVRDEAGAPVAVEGIARDVTERRRAEEALLRHEKERIVAQMAGGVAHNLNQSLALVGGYLELAEQALAVPPADAEAVRGMLAVARQAVRDGGEMVARLLRIGRPPHEGGASGIDVGEVLREVAEVTAPRWRAQAQGAGRPIALTVEAGTGCVVLGRPSELREALVNLVFNAVDALPGGGTIRLAARRRDEAVEVTVADSGVGMPPEVRARIFEPFFTTKGEAGTGLGLAGVLAIVERHAGAVAVESEPGRGTTFRITLPLADEAPAATPPPEAAPPLGPLRILAVDDEPRLPKMVHLMLRQHGHAVVQANSGEEALARLEAEPFDVVLSDVNMGAGMSGWALAHRVGERWPGTRFVLATGWGAQIDADRARAAGVAAVVSKPYSKDELLLALCIP
jgi:hypothetical protein